MDRVTALPGVRAVSVMREKLLTGRVSMNSIWVPGYTLRSGEEAGNLWAVANGVGPKFFATSGMRIVAGRDFSEQDNERAAKVAVLNETMARHFFGTRDPVGQRISWAKSEPASVEIVGVVRDIKYIGLREDKMDVIFTPILQDQDAWIEATLLIRTSTDSTSMLNDVRAAVRGVDPNLPVYDLTTMDRQIQSTLTQPRLMAILSSFFGILALGLSAVGLHGVLSYNVVQRTSEIGIRMALGAQRAGILHLVLGETARVVAIGIALGIAIALSAARLIQSLLFGIKPTNSFALAGSIAILTMVALLAGFLPAYRASRVDPVTALRHE
jgi:predicted permease